VVSENFGHMMFYAADVESGLIHSKAEKHFYARKNSTVHTEPAPGKISINIFLQHPSTKRTLLSWKNDTLLVTSYNVSCMQFVQGGVLTYREVQLLSIDRCIKGPCKLMLPESFENHLLEILQLIGYAAHTAMAVSCCRDDAVTRWGLVVRFVVNYSARVRLAIFRWRFNRHHSASLNT